MKISIKKKYIFGTAFFVSCVFGLLIFDETLKLISHKEVTFFIVPIVFLISTTYTIHYFISLRIKEKLADEVSKEVSNRDTEKADKIKSHLYNKSWEEAYTINVLKGKIKFTSSWEGQTELEKTKPIKR